MAFNDARCPKCSKRFGWQGRLIDCPPCPRCGHQIPKEEWASDEAEMLAFEKLLLERRQKRDNRSIPDDPKGSDTPGSLDPDGSDQLPVV